MQAGNPNFATVILSGLFTLVSGGGALWWIEGIWKPRRTRQRVALILVRELAMNRRTLVHLAPKVRNTETEAIIPVDFALSRIGLESVGLHLGELPPEVVSDIIGFYKFLDHLDRIFASYQHSTVVLEGLENRDSLIAREAVASKRGAVEQFKESLEEAIRWCDTAMEELGTMAEDPDWKRWIEDREAIISHDPAVRRTSAPSLRPPRPPGTT
jgi:hypothetical protein